MLLSHVFKVFREKEKKKERERERKRESKCLKIKKIYCKQIYRNFKVNLKHSKRQINDKTDI
jgi:hypothetical protein